jgi:CRP-like cAMP-binding protein
MDVGADNALLAMLPAAPRAALQPHVSRVSLVQRQILWNTSQPITDVLFPVTALVAIVGQADKGEDVEVAAVGRTGLVGLPAFLGDSHAAQAAVVQLPGEADRIAAAAFREVAAHQPDLRRVIHRFIQAFFTEAAQTAVCNCHHHAERRLARWLLTCQDRSGRAEFPLTHEFISQMLGMRRATVTGELGKLQTAGLIRATPGRVVLLDRAGLERLACECYRIISGEYHRLLGGEAR